MRSTRRTETGKRRGLALSELLLTIFIMGFAATGVLAMLSSASRTVDRRTSENSLGGRSRASLDETLRELRAANQIAPYRTIGGSTYYTNKNNIVFMAPGYSMSMGILLNTFDVVALRHNVHPTNPELSTLTETTLVNGASDRPKRTNVVLTRRVKSVTYVYRIREYFVVEPGSTLSSVTLKALPATMPQVSIGDTPVAIAGSTPSLTVTFSSAVAATADTGPRIIQVLYTVDPETNPAAMEHVTGVDATLTLEETGGRNKKVTVTLSGGARLRNKRI